MNIVRPLQLCLLGSCLALGLAGRDVVAQSYPNRPIKVIVAYQPGGGSDNIARIVGQKLSERLGQAVVIENKPGANGIVGTEYAAKAAPDGYTLLLGSDSEFVWSVGLYDKLPYDPVKDFAPVSRLSSTALIFAVSPSSGVHSLRELIAQAKAKPGGMFYSAGAPVFRVAGELLKKQAGIDIGFVPYKGTGPAVTAAVAGEVAMVSSSIGPLLAQLKAGKLRALAITAPQRSPQTPDVPTMNEAGMPNFVLVPWQGLFAPAGTPTAIIERLSREIAAALNDPEVKARLTTLGVDAGYMSPTQFGDLIKSDLAKWPKLTRELGIKAE